MDDNYHLKYVIQIIISMLKKEKEFVEEILRKNTIQNHYTDLNVKL